MASRLATASVTTQLLRLRGRVIVNAKEQHFVVDSPIYLGGPNEAINPIDLLLSALASHALFVIEKAAQQMQIPLDNVGVTVSGDFDPRGVLGDAVDPGLRSLKVQLAFAGPDEAQAEILVEAFKTRCSIYVTLARAARTQVDWTLPQVAKA